MKSDFEITQQVLLPALESLRKLIRDSGDGEKPTEWHEAERVLFELGEIIERLRCAAPINPNRLVAIFEPTGPVQRVSLARGWGDEFLRIAEEVDRAAGLLGWE